MHQPPQEPLELEPRQGTHLSPLRDREPIRPRPLIDDSASDEDSRPGISIAHRLWVIRRNMWAIAAFVICCTVATAILSGRITRIYEAAATIDVDRRAPAGVVGQDATSAAVGDTEQFLNTQVRLIQSDAVLKPVAREFGINRAPGSIGLSDLKITRPTGTFLILISYRSPDPRRAADLANSVASSYIQSTYDIRYRSTMSLSSFMEKQIEELRAKMEGSSQALTRFEQELNMIRPEETNGIISARLLQLNTEYTTAQADRARKQAAFESLKNGNLASAEVSSQGEAFRRLMDRVDEAREKFTEAQRLYGKEHPEYKKSSERLRQLTAEIEQFKSNVSQRAESEYNEAANRELILQKSVTETKAEFDHLNTRAFQYQNLKREADADRKLYEELSNRIKEAGINAGFQNSSVRLADAAAASNSPVYPDIPRNLELAFLCSLVLAIGVSFAADAMDATVRSPEDVERALGSHVVGILPLVKNWRGGWLGAAVAGKELEAQPKGGTLSQANFYEDAVCSLRNSILLSAVGEPLRTLLVTSSSPAEGKTTTASHLAIAHAQQKRKTLLIDCDLRRPGVRRLFEMGDGRGLSNVLSGAERWQDQLSTHATVPDLDILLAGTASRRHADLVGRYLPQVLREAGPNYDLIIVDSPPILGFPEPLQLATSVDGVVLVALAGKTNRKAIGTAISTLQRLRANLIGIVLNEVTRNTTVDYYHYGYYGRYGRYGRYNTPESAS